MYLPLYFIWAKKNYPESPWQESLTKPFEVLVFPAQIWAEELIPTLLQNELALILILTWFKALDTEPVFKEFKQ